MTEVLAILTPDDVLAMLEHRPFDRSRYVLTFERDGRRYQRRMCDCDVDEALAVHAASFAMRAIMKARERKRFDDWFGEVTMIEDEFVAVAAAMKASNDLPADIARDLDTIAAAIKRVWHWLETERHKLAS
jgi:hypothetical protein